MKIKITIISLLILVVAAGCTYSLSSVLNGNTTQQLISEAKHLDLVAAAWEQKKEADSAFYYYAAAHEKYREAKNSGNTAKNLLKMAQIQFAAGDYPGSEASAIKALRIYDRLRDTSALLETHKHLAATHRELYNNNKALYYLEKAYKLETNPLNLLKIQSAIARLHIADGDYITALKLLDLAKKSPDLNVDALTKAAVLDRTGYATFKLDNSKGLDLMAEALEIRQCADDTDGIVLSYVHLSEYYTIVNPENAKLCALKAYSIAWPSDNTRRKLHALLQLVAISTGKDANMYAQYYGALKNEANLKAQAIENKFEKMLDNAATLGDPAHIARLEISKDNNKILALALMASIFSSVLLFYQLTQRHKRERLLHAYATETRLSKKIHDEIANELYGTLNYIEHEEVVSGTKKEKLIEQLDNIYLMTRNISRENNDIDTGLRFPVQLKLMLSAYANINVNIIVKGISKVSWDKIESIKKIATYRVLQELMVNMSKHSKATVVLVDFSIDKNKVKIIYSDNGVGTKCPKINSTNGLQNVENRMVSIGGSISFDTKSEKGFHLTLTYPLPILYV